MERWTGSGTIGMEVRRLVLSSIGQD
jgi:hypothetical protein